MFDVFTEQIEVLIKDGIANLYWYKGDLQKAWLRAGVPNALKDRISAAKDADGNTISKRKQMDRLYEELRGGISMNALQHPATSSEFSSSTRISCLRTLGIGSTLPNGVR